LLIQGRNGWWDLTYGIGGISWADACDIERGSGADAVARSLAVGLIFVFVVWVAIARLGSKLGSIGTLGMVTDNRSSTQRSLLSKLRK
jgi:hypothetical protein